MLKSLSFLPSWTVDDSDLEGYGFHRVIFRDFCCNQHHTAGWTIRSRLNYSIRRFELCNTFVRDVICEFLFIVMSDRTEDGEVNTKIII